MAKWEHRERKLVKRTKKTQPKIREQAHKDKLDRRNIREAQRSKELIWDNFESEGEL
jgi:hypothetical protein